MLGKHFPKKPYRRITSACRQKYWIWWTPSIKNSPCWVVSFRLVKKTGTSRMNLIQETQGWYWNSWMWRTVNEMPTLPPDRVSFYRLLVMRIGCLSQDGPDSVWHAKLQARTKRILSVWEVTWEVGPAWSRSSIRNITAMRSPCTSMRILLHVYQRDALRVV